MKNLLFTLLFTIIGLNFTISQNTILFSDNFETPQSWTIFEELVSGNACYGGNIGEVARSSDVAYGGSNALRVWANKNGSTKSNHVIAAHHISNTNGITGRLRYGMWAYSATNLGLTQSGPELSVQSTRTVGAQNLTYIAGIQYIGNQWITDKWNIWHEGTWKAIKFSELGTTLTANTWYYLELEFDMTTNSYISFKIQGGGLNTTLDLKQAFQNAPSGFKIGGEARNWTPSYFVTTESENLWSTCTQVHENKVYYDDVTLEQIILPTPPKCYQLVWADEFSGSSLDLTKWTPIVGPGGEVSGNNELQYYTSRTNNIQVSNGSLKIIALSENYGGNAYTSGRMQTKNLGDWLYGRMEARIKLPVAKGMWPAFWMLPTDNIYGNWPRSGEIDIMELIGTYPSRAYGTIHTHDNGVVKTFTSSYNLPSSTFANDFHVFATEWSPNEIKFYVDNALYATNTSVSPYPWVFDKRFYLLLNLAIGGNWAGVPDGTTMFPQQMEVDYVRVYQKLNNIAITGKTLVEPTTNGVAYSVPSLADATYQWSISGTGNSIASGQGTNQVSINWGSNNGTLSLLLNDGCVPSATVSTDVTVSPNLWANFGLEQNYVNWDTRPAYSSSVNFNITTADVAEGSKAASIQVNTVGANPWNIQLSRTNIDLVSGVQYYLRFKAKSDAARSIPIAVIRSSDFSGIAYQTINLTTTWQTFTMRFTAPSNVNVMFNADLAAALGTYYFDDFLFAREALLPLELLSFQGQTEHKTNLLRWQFADTKDFESLEIQKSSDAKNFIPLSILSKKDIFYVDTFPFEITYYRLKMVDIDNKTTFSKIISLHTPNTEGVLKKDFKIYPNPVTQDFNIEIWDKNATSIECKDILGKTIFLKPIDNTTSTHTLSIKTIDMPAGIYFLKTNTPQSQVQQLIKMQ
jgi:beta-glucanase (GH16 family)